MQQQTVTYNCTSYDANTKRLAPFRVIKYIFNYSTSSEDKELLDYFISEGTKLAQLVNPKGANDSSKKREYEKILNNCIAGVISEYLWKEYLNSEKECVSETELLDMSAQIDLKVLSNNKKIEVRSSFPRNGIDFALCSGSFEFDVIGMYSNNYKPNEVQKDFYVRALFHLEKVRDWVNPKGQTVPIIAKLLDKIKQPNFEVFLTGGATWEMMIDDKIAKNKSFIPDDERSIERISSPTTYRVVPFSKALDTLDIFELISK